MQGCDELEKLLGGTYKLDQMTLIKSETLELAKAKLISYLKIIKAIRSDKEESS